MTAETDALRHEIALSNHMKMTLEYDPDGSRKAILWNEANEPIADGDAPVLPAAPSVQPAAGREEIARIVLDAVFEGFEHGECEKEWEPDYGRELAEKATSRILTALAHQPAQGSESGGERLGLITQALVRADEEFGTALSAYRYRKLAEAVAAALSQPGPASEGDGE